MGAAGLAANVGLGTGDPVPVGVSAALGCVLAGLAGATSVWGTVAGAALADSLTFCTGVQDGQHIAVLVAGTVAAAILAALLGSSALAPKPASAMLGLLLAVALVVLVTAVLFGLLTLDLATDTSYGPIDPTCQHSGASALLRAAPGVVPALVLVLTSTVALWRALGRLAVIRGMSRWHLISPVYPPDSDTDGRGTAFTPR